MPENQLTKQIGQLSELVKVDQKELIDLLKKNSLPNCSDAEFAFVVGLCNTYQLNPLTNEVCFLRTKGGRLIPYVEYDGWVKIANRQPEYNGVEFTENFDINGVFISVTCKIHLKEKHPTILTEYLSECQDKSKTPWIKYPIRMLRNKSFNQAIRTTFGISGIYDPDEAERIIQDAEVITDEQPKVEMPKSISGSKEESKIEPTKQETPKTETKEIKNSKIKPEYLKKLIKAKTLINDIPFFEVLKESKLKNIEEIPNDETAVIIIKKCGVIYDKTVGAN